MEKAILKVAEELRNIRKELQHLNRTLEHSRKGVYIDDLANTINHRIVEQSQEPFS